VSVSVRWRPSAPFADLVTNWITTELNVSCVTAGCKICGEAAPAALTIFNAPTGVFPMPAQLLGLAAQ
jgi:hypothetical protein